MNRTGTDAPGTDSGAAHVHRLKAAINRGETGDKVAFPDPAAAPLGTDDEAAGIGPHPQLAPHPQLEGHSTMSIRDIMTTQVELIGPDTSLAQAARKMRDADIGALPVGENDRLVGMVTDRDITVRAVAEGRDPNTTPVREALSAHTIYIFDDQSTDEAARMMAEQQVRRLPVLNRDKRLVGIVALADLACEGGDDSLTARAAKGVSQP